MRTWEGWLYLAVGMDLYSCRIVGWSTKPTHTLIHSDQGSQFGAMRGGASAMRIIWSPV